MSLNLPLTPIRCWCVHSLFGLCEDDGWVLRDLNSTNGTWVNGKAARTCHLKDGDTIEIGKHRLVFVAGREADVGVATQSMDAVATRD